MRVLVTGGSRGLGFEIAKSFKDKGHNVCIVSRHKDRLAAAFEDLNGNEEDLMMAIDLSKQTAVKEILEHLRAQNWNPHIIINNAAQYMEDNFLSARIDILSELMQLNAVSGFDLIRNLMNEKNASLKFIISVGSVLSRDFRREAVSYTVSKHMQDAFASIIAKEARKRKIKSTLLLPGSMNTTSWDGLDVPREKFIQPADVVKLIHTLITLSENCWVEEIVLKPMEDL